MKVGASESKLGSWLSERRKKAPSSLQAIEARVTQLEMTLPVLLLSCCGVLVALQTRNKGSAVP